MPYPRALAIERKESLDRMSGISARTIGEHWRVYESFVARANDVRERLQRAAPLDQPHFPALRRELALALNGMKLHAIYFSNLGGAGGEPEGAFAELAAQDFGSFVTLRRELTGAALAADGWACAVVDQDDGHLYLLGDEEVWEGSPVLAVDVAEHAYLLDHGMNRDAYITAFWANVDWDDVNARTHRALRRAQA